MNTLRVKPSNVEFQYCGGLLFGQLVLFYECRGILAIALALHRIPVHVVNELL